MAILLTTTIGPAGDFPLVQATDIGMPDGSRLSEFNQGIGEETERRIAALEEQDEAFKEAAEMAIGGLTAIGIRLNKLEKPATSVDLTNFEASGVIVETYADGTQKTYTMEFDGDGNPTKVTDSDGNVTVLTW